MNAPFRPKEDTKFSILLIKDISYMSTWIVIFQFQSRKWMAYFRSRPFSPILLTTTSPNCPELLMTFFFFQKFTPTYTCVKVSKFRTVRFELADRAKVSRQARIGHREHRMEFWSDARNLRRRQKKLAGARMFCPCHKTLSRFRKILN